VHIGSDAAGGPRSNDLTMNATMADPRDEVLTDDEDALRELAVLQLKKRRELRTHVVVYVLVNSVIWGIWLVIALTSAKGTWWPWPIFPTLGWGIGLALNAWDVYFRRPITEADVQEEVRRLRRAA
jgi:2TM domain-containing protein